MNLGIIPDASGETLMPIMTSKIVPDSIVYSDSWRGQLMRCVRAILKAGPPPPSITGIERHAVAFSQYRSGFAAGCNLRPYCWGRRRVLVQR